MSGIRTKYFSGFLSTLSLRRATLKCYHGSAPAGISIHALLAESDISREISLIRPYAFLSTLSLRRATSSPDTDIIIFDISIHALLAESDIMFAGILPHDGYFYPRSPCGERQRVKFQLNFINQISIHALLAESDCRNWRKQSNHHKFLSTLSLRRATVGANNHVRVRQNFYPRSPCGERPVVPVELTTLVKFYPRSLRRATY